MAMPQTVKHQRLWQLPPLAEALKKLNLV